DQKTAYDAASEATFTISVSNSGYVNANRVRLTIEGFDGVLVHDPLDKDELEKRENSLLLPRPPTPPRGTYVSAAHSITHNMPTDFASMIRPRERDPWSFYYDDRPYMPSETLQLTCEALPHQSSSYNLKFRLLRSESELGAKPRIRIRIEASNLRKPIEKYLAVSFDVQPTSFKEHVEKMLCFRPAPEPR
ncbi:hypothetical protein, partial [Rhodoplanes sp. SY1]|uniref:hypothetical protein n=1 Tax=Rhodoplanes sp. SY1 TaxID=3166646 RepID=UPI0038B48DC4